MESQAIHILQLLSGPTLTLDMHLYMAFEGRRFWPRRIFSIGVSRQRARLLSLIKSMRHAKTEITRPTTPRVERIFAERAYGEAALEISRYPFGDEPPKPRALWPTRLGNLIASYEEYPLLKYGLDAVFFWPRIWVSIGQELREEIDNQQAQVDGLLYASAALMFSSLILLVYIPVRLHSPDWLALDLRCRHYALLAAVFFILGLFIYRISLHAHAHFGELFKSIFDQYRSTLLLDDVVRLVAKETDDPSHIFRSGMDKNIAAWRFLRWHRIRRPNERHNRYVRMK